MPDSVRNMLELWPSLEALAVALREHGFDVTASGISKWGQSGKIEPRYWLALVSIAREWKPRIRGVSLRTLAALHASNSEVRA